MPPANLLGSDFAEPIVAAGRQMASAGVAAVFLVHGTFGGNDGLGLLTELARFAPGLSRSLARYRKSAFDWAAGEKGNYTNEYAQRMQQCLSAGAGYELAVHNWVWSSQNNHIGRADGAVQLLVDLASFAAEIPTAKSHAQSPRVLLWGHSHAGNVFALASSLLAADADQRSQFFRAARRFYRRWRTGEVDMPAWTTLETMLAQPEHPLRQLSLDAATFGTPIRYGWAAGGVQRLIHFVNHRPGAANAEFLAPGKIELGRLLSAADGDYIAQIGVAGSNLAPSPLALRTFLADRALDRLLEFGVSRESLLRRIGYGMRVAHQGTTLLVDYQDQGGAVHQHIAGHAVYTRSRWLPMHCEQVAEILYDDAPGDL